MGRGIERRGRGRDGKNINEKACEFVCVCVKVYVNLCICLSPTPPCRSDVNTGVVLWNPKRRSPTVPGTH